MPSPNRPVYGANRTYKDSRTEHRERRSQAEIEADAKGSHPITEPTFDDTDLRDTFDPYLR